MWISRKRNSHPLCYSLLTRFFYSHASPSSSSSFLCLPRSLFAVGVCEVLSHLRLWVIGKKKNFLLIPSLSVGCCRCCQGCLSFFFLCFCRLFSSSPSLSLPAQEIWRRDIIVEVAKKIRLKL